MATTPFTTTSVATPGAWPGRIRDTPPGLRRYWLGRAGQLVELPAPKIGRETTESSGESVHTSAGGTTSVFRRPGPSKRRFVLEWDRLAGRDWQVVHGFYRRAFGPGPWCYLPPEDVNRLEESQSLCTDPSRFTLSNDAVLQVATSPAVSGVSPVAPSSVLRWSGGQITFRPPVTPGAQLVSFDGAVLAVKSAPATFSLWLWTESGTRTARLFLENKNAAGNGVGSSNFTDVTITPTPQRFTLTIAAGTLDAAGAYLLPSMQTLQAGDFVCFAAVQVEYHQVATDFAVGSGVPSVVWTDPPGRRLDARLRSAVTMTLVE